MLRVLAIITVFMLLLPAGGCAVYQFELLEPAELAQVVSEPTAFDVPPLEYIVLPQGERLVVRIDNRTDEPVTLLGERSYLVDPNGQSHAMRGGTIAPHSFIAMSLPPRPAVVHAGPRLGVGVGVGRGYRWGGVGMGVGGYYPYDHWHTPHRYYLYNPEAAYWRWTTGPVHMRLVYDVAGEIAEHRLAFNRSRVQ
jgi:hypothetical protein